MRETVRAVQRRIGMTTILVTHDQEEAFALADRIGVMQMGRLLETGTPEELYRHPATRFVARFLGAANLFLGEVSRQGLHLGAATLAPDRALPQSSAGAEAVLVVRPEDIEIAAGDQAPLSRPFASGVIEALTFAGHQQHVRVRLGPECGIEPATGPVTGDDSREPEAFSVDALRSAAEQASAPLTVGAAVRLGVRRLHALPTPISSFRLITADAGAADALEANLLLAQLVRSMQARVTRQAGAERHDERLDAGICVLPLGAGTAADIATAVAHGARRILCLPALNALPARMLVHAGDAARRGELLALVSSVMRHLPVEATAVTLQRAAASRSEVVEAQRTLLDTRADLRGAHGLDLRGERFVGDLRAWLSGLVTQAEPVLVVMALPAAPNELADFMARNLDVLFQGTAHAAVLFAIDGRP